METEEEEEGQNQQMYSSESFRSKRKMDVSFSFSATLDLGLAASSHYSTRSQALSYERLEKTQAVTRERREEDLRGEREREREREKYENHHISRRLLLSEESGGLVNRWRMGSDLTKGLGLSFGVIGRSEMKRLLFELELT